LDEGMGGGTGTQATNITQLVTLGTGTITFLCVDPFAYGEDTTQDLAEECTVNNPGTSNGFPIFNVTLSDSVTFLTITKDDQILLLGAPASVDEIPVPAKERIIYDEMTDTTLWNVGSITDYGGTIQGNFETTGAVFEVQSYGTVAKSTWAGPALVRSAAQPFHDFNLDVLVNWDTTNDKDAMGRIEIYGLDANNAVLCKMVIGDYWYNSKMSQIIMRAGAKTADNCVEIMDTYGKKKGDLNSYYGHMVIQRVGQKWTCTTARRTSTVGVYEDTITKTWYDTKKEWDQDIASVEIHAAMYGGHKNLKTFTIDHVFLYQLNNAGAEQVPNIGDVGDVVTIDCSKSAAYVNGIPRLDIIDPTCDLPDFKLVPGQTALEIEPWDSIESAQMTLSPAYL